MSTTDNDSRIEALETQVGDLKSRIQSLEATVKSLMESEQPSSSSRGSTSKKGSKKKKKSSLKKRKKSATKGSGLSDKGTRKTSSAFKETQDYKIFGRKIFINYPKDPVDWLAWKNKQKKQKTEVRRDLEIEWIYGYPGSLRDNLYYTPAEHGSEFLYTIGSMGVTYNPTDNTQRYFGLEEHTEDVISCAMHPILPLAATGQVAPKGEFGPHFCVWNYKTSELMASIEYHDRGVAVLAFSHDGKYLISIGDEDQHYVAIWQCPTNMNAKSWKALKNKPLATAVTTTQGQVFGARFARSLIKRDGKDVYEFVTYGTTHFKWSKIDPSLLGNEKFLTGDSPSSYSVTKIIQKAYNCAEFSREAGEGGAVMTGTGTGHLYIFDAEKKLQSWNQISKKAVGAICAKDDYYIVGSHDGKIRFYDWEDKLTETVDVGKGKVNCMFSNNDKVALGMTNAQMWCMTLNEERTLEMVNDGFTGEVWGMDTHPDKPLMVVGAQDKRIKFWNLDEQKMISERRTKHKIKCCAFSSNGKYVAFGSFGGSIIVGNAEDLEAKEWVVFEKSVGKEAINAIVFTPNCKYLVCGGSDQVVRAIVVKDWKVKKPMKGHSTAVTTITCSTDNNTVMSNSGDLQTLFWSLKKGGRITASDLDVNISWDSWKNKLGWMVQGVWHASTDATDVNSVNISGTNDNVDDDKTKVIVTGDDNGNVTLFNYPCVVQKPTFKEYMAHSSFVTEVRFTNDSSRIISTGGRDLSVVQWKLT